MLVYADLPSIHQNSSPKPVRRNKEKAYFNYNIEKNLKAKYIYIVLLDVVCIKAA